MNAKDFRDFKNYFSLNIDVETKFKTISEYIKLVASFSRTNPEHLEAVNNFLDATITDLDIYITNSILTDEKQDADC